MELQQKEDEMRQQFVIRVKEKETELKEAEKEVTFSYIILFFPRI
jgi:septin 6/8/11